MIDNTLRNKIKSFLELSESINPGELKKIIKNLKQKKSLLNNSDIKEFKNTMLELIGSNKNHKRKHKNKIHSEQKLFTL